MTNIKSLLLNGIEQNDESIICNDDLLEFYIESFEECRERLKDLAWCNKNKEWDFEHIKIIYDSIDKEFETIVEDVGNIGFKFAEAILLDSDFRQRQNRFWSLQEDEDNPVDLCAPLLMAIKYIQKGLLTSKISPSEISRIGQLISCSTTLLVTFYSSEKSIGELEELAELKARRQEKSAKAGRKLKITINDMQPLKIQH